MHQTKRFLLSLLLSSLSREKSEWSRSASRRRCDAIPKCLHLQHQRMMSTTSPRIRIRNVCAWIPVQPPVPTPASGIKCPQSTHIRSRPVDERAMDPDLGSRVASSPSPPPNQPLLLLLLCLYSCFHLHRLSLTISCICAGTPSLSSDSNTHLSCTAFESL